MQRPLNKALEKSASTETQWDSAINKALRIYSTDQQVKNHNEAVLKHFSDLAMVIFKIKAQDQLMIEATRNVDNTNLETIIPTDINKIGGLP